MRAQEPRIGRAGHGEPARGAAEAGASSPNPVHVVEASRTPWLKGPHGDRGHEQEEGRKYKEPELW